MIGGGRGGGGTPARFAVFVFILLTSRLRFVAEQARMSTNTDRRVNQTRGADFRRVGRHFANVCFALFVFLG